MISPIYSDRFQQNIWHIILLDKVCHYGVTETARQWFNRYLAYRYQYVDYNNTISDMEQISRGAPQRPIYDLHNFLLYINYIASMSNIPPRYYCQIEMH